MWPHNQISPIGIGWSWRTGIACLILAFSAHQLATLWQPSPPPHAAYVFQAARRPRPRPRVGRAERKSAAPPHAHLNTRPLNSYEVNKSRMHNSHKYGGYTQVSFLYLHRDEIPHTPTIYAASITVYV